MSISNVLDRKTTIVTDDRGKRLYTIKILSDEEFDKLPFKHAKESLGAADQSTMTAYVRKVHFSEATKDLTAMTLRHEVEELIAKTSPHEEDGIRYKKGIGGLKLFKDIIAPTAAFLAGNFVGGPIVGGAAAGATKSAINNERGVGRGAAKGAVLGAASRFGGLGGAAIGAGGGAIIGAQDPNSTASQGALSGAIGGGLAGTLGTLDARNTTGGLVRSAGSSISNFGTSVANFGGQTGIIGATTNFIGGGIQQLGSGVARLGSSLQPSNAGFGVQGPPLPSQIGPATGGAINKAVTSTVNFSGVKPGFFSQIGAGVKSLLGKGVTGLNVGTGRSASGGIGTFAGIGSAIRDKLSNPMTLLGLGALGIGSLSTQPDFPNIGEITSKWLTAESVTKAGELARNLANETILGDFVVPKETTALIDVIQGDIKKQFKQRRTDLARRGSAINPQFAGSGEFLELMNRIDEEEQDELTKVSVELTSTAQQSHAQNRYNTIIRDLNADDQTKQDLLFAEISEVVSRYGFERQDVLNFREIAADAGLYFIQQGTGFGQAA